MAFEVRGGRRYYYRKTRVDGKVVSEYVGEGYIAALAARLDHITREKQELARHDWQRLVQEQDRVDQAVDQYRGQVRQLVADVLRHLGFHQHKRQWRKARTMVDKLPTSGRGPEADEYLDLYRLAIGKPAKSDAVMKLKLYARDHPQVFDDVSLFAKSTLTAVAESASDTETTRLQMLGEVKALRKRLGVAEATPLEQLLIEDVAICWLRMHVTEQLYTSNCASPGMGIANLEFWDRRLASARRRYLSSIESLARVRGLLSRAGVQINLAQQMVVQNG